MSMEDEVWRVWYRGTETETLCVWTTEGITRCITYGRRVEEARFLCFPILACLCRVFGSSSLDLENVSSRQGRHDGDHQQQTTRETKRKNL